MKLEDSKSNDFGNSKTKSDEGENDIRSRLRKNPNKTKFLYTGDFNDQKSKKKNEGSSPQNVKEICRSILEIIKKDEKSFLFRQPAIKSFIDNKDKEIYKKQIKEPRDLGTIAKKLKSNDYSAKNFYDDMELCWSNAMSFNDTNTTAYQNAVYLKEVCSKLYKDKGLLDFINKEDEKEIDKDINSNNHGSSNNNTNDSNNTPNKTPSKINKKDKSKNKKEAEKNENTESISSNSYNSDKSSYKNDNTDSSYSSEIKNNKLIGRKRKRQKNKDNKNNEQNEEKDEENKSEEKEKKIPKKRGRKKKIKSNDDDEKTNNDLNQSKITKKLALDDIKKKFPINHQVFSCVDDLDKTLKKKSKINSKNKSININHSNHHNSERHKRRKNSNSNNNNNTPYMTKEESRKIFFEYMWEFFNGKPFFPNYFEAPGQVNPYFQKNFGNDYFNFNPMRYKVEKKEMMNYDNNCNTESVYNINSTNHKRKQSQSKINIKTNKNNNNSQNNNNNEVKNANSNNNSNNGNIVKIIDKKDEKNMQLRIEIAKYFDNLSDNNMIDVLVYIENIRPQSLRVLQNDTIYIDMEAFNEETFNKVFDFVKKYF